MKAHNEKLGNLEVVSRNESGTLNVVKANGQLQIIIAKFVELLDENNNVIVDYSSLPVAEKVIFTKSAVKESKPSYKDSESYISSNEEYKDNLRKYGK